MNCNLRLSDATDTPNTTQIYSRFLDNIPNVKFIENVILIRFRFYRQVSSLYNRLILAPKRGIKAQNILAQNLTTKIQLQATYN